MAVGLAAGAYSVGLLIVNLRLARFGVYSAGFVRTEYVLVGSLFVFLVALAHVSFSHGVNELGSCVAAAKERMWKRAVWHAANGLLTLTSVAFLPLIVVSEGRLLVEAWKLWFAAFILIGTGIWLQQTQERVLAVWRQITVSTDDSIESRKRQVSQVLNLLNIAPFLLLAAAGYAHGVYPHISPAFGGGYRDQAIFLANEKGIEIAANLGLPQERPANLVGPLELLHESEKEYIVLPHGTESRYRAIRLNRSQFELLANVQRKFDKRE